MKNSSPLFLCLLLIFIWSCKEKSENFVVDKSAEDASTASQNASITGKKRTNYRYVIAPSGLSLRKENNVTSEKLLGMPLGSELLLLEAVSDPSMEVEHIKGGMQKVAYNGQTGYAFSGYLSPIPLPEKEQSVEDYITALKTNYPEIQFETKANDPDFHEGITETFSLPVKSWHEAYYLVAAMYQIPKKLGFPKPTGSAEETIEDPAKPAEVWDSYLGVERKENELQKIGYYYRSEGFGHSVVIIRKAEKLFEIEYLGFVD